MNGRFRVLRALGRGATATVYEVIDLQSGAHRALKLLRPEADEAILRAEFSRLSRWEHPHLVRVHDLGRVQTAVRTKVVRLEAGALFLVMDLVRGKDPAEALSGAADEERDPLLRQIASGLAQALAHLHGHGLVHHDVKPENVLLAEDGRAVLIDLGLAVRQQPGSARGTMAYMAPEALVGEGDHRVDLYGLGATLFCWAEGRPPFCAVGPELVKRIFDEEPRLAAAWLDPQTAQLILTLLRKDPARRPGSARAVLAELARIRGDHHAVAELSTRAELLPPAMVGRGQLLETLQSLLARLGAPGQPRVVLLVGEPGTGKTRALREALRRHLVLAAAERCPPIRIVAGSPTEIQRALDRERDRGRSGAPASTDLDERAILLMDGLEQLAERGDPLLVHLPEVESDPLAMHLLRIVLRGAGGESARPPLLVVAEVGLGGPDQLGAAAGPALQCHRLDALTRLETAAMLESMLGHSAPGDLVSRIARLSSGSPMLVAELTRQWYEHGEAGLDLDQAPKLEVLVSKRRSHLPPHQRAVMDALAVWGEPAGAADVAQLALLTEEEAWCAMEELHRSGGARLEGGQARLADAAHLRAWRRAAGDSAQPLHRRAAEMLEQAGGDDVIRLAEHWLAAGGERGLPLALKAGRQLGGSAPLRAIELLERVVAGSAAELRTEAVPLLAELYIQTGRYDQALELLGDGRGTLGLLRAQTLQRLGQYERAEGLLREVRAELAAEEEQLRATALLGRLMLQQGRHTEAQRSTAPEVERALSQPARGLGLSPAAASLLEVAGLAHYYLGDLAEADRLFASGASALEGQAAPARQARFANLRGMVACAGNLQSASAHFGRALALVADGGDAHGRASYLANLGSIELECGRLGEALGHLTTAVRDLERLARTAELATVYCNLTNLLMLLGDLEHGSRVVSKAAALAERLGSRHAQAHARLTEGDIQRRQGAPALADASYQAAAALFEATSSRREQVLVALSRAEALAEAGRPDQSLPVLTEARRLMDDQAAPGSRADAAEPSELAAELRGHWAASRARVLLAGGAELVLAERELIERSLAEHCARLQQRGAARDLWRAALVMGRLMRRVGRPQAARAALQRARTTWEEIVSHSPEVYRERMNADPDARTLAAEWQSLLEAGSGPEAMAPPPGPAAAAGDRSRRLLAINKRLNSELRLPRLLELIMDTIIELTGAERGFLLLVEPDGSLSIKLARNIDRQTLEGESCALSRSIAEKAARTAQPVVTVDAATDGRFRDAMSVSDLNLRSVLAAPLPVKGSVVGTVYIDSRLRRGLFGEAEVALVQDVADQAAIAIENARLLTENVRRQKEIEILNRQLQHKVESQAAELQEVKEELRSSREALQTRHDYHGIVGRSVKMKDLFHLLDRITETDLPVVIEGESGTGKELVARAIHQNGARAGCAFISENCAAIPEGLLESVLFGHVRGAFTGADRDRKGLFEVASGGTLFLDEVGEMSPAMQAKLLRVLQDGEFRRVGGTQTLRTDVRLIAASNKDLSQLVAQGRFREDLFYRLHVVLVRLPCLRDRREDIPLLVEHFLAKHVQGQPRRLTAEAMALLTGYGWPGNVRELENEIMRAAALAGRTIQARDLSPHIGRGVPLELADPHDLQLRPRVEHLERELIRRALAQSSGNHTRAARLLGLSRFGLLKKLRRYGES